MSSPMPSSTYLNAKAAFSPETKGGLPGSSRKASRASNVKSDSKSTPRRSNTMNSPKSTKSEGSRKVVSHPLHANPSKNINPRTVNHRSVPSVDLYHAPDSPMETSEAAAALRANAAVKISKLGKVLKNKGKAKKDKRLSGGEREVVSDSEIADLRTRKSFTSTSLKSSHMNPPTAGIFQSFSMASGVVPPQQHSDDANNIKKKRRRLKRKKKREKRKEEKARQRSYVKGNVIDARHELYTLSIAMMLGLSHSISEGRDQELTRIVSGDESPQSTTPNPPSPTADTNTAGWGQAVKAPVALFATGTGKAFETVVDVAGKIADTLTPKDFRETGSVYFPPRGSYDNVSGVQLTPPHNLAHTFRFKNYANNAFTSLRKTFNISTESYLQSICGNSNFIDFVSNSRSGQFFFYSHDGKYMIKTMSVPESKYLLKILPDYHAYVTSNPKTLITKFLGSYKVKLYHLNRNVRFVVMKSVFDTDVNLDTFYDLKGSVLGRRAKEGESVLKDNDLRDLVASRGFGFATIDGEAYRQMRATLVDDLKFFKSQNIIDYSMLVGTGVERKKLRGFSRSSSAGSRLDVSDADLSSSDDESSPPSPSQLRPSARSDCGHPIKSFKNSDNTLAYFGVIDILQPYTPLKRLESLSKSVFNRGGKGAISCVEPDFYGERFLRFFDFYMKRGEMPAGEGTSEED
ncbi:hypothetical protein TrST_g1280 [Triparma strigata]|uniref:PIPK domain-containing protein n=1 Tax=Triparma strigata TaxID=1606541 RepID=A0A9W6ZND0_9STRA|nr:hypothetical protein TrST_g1280 [Triparma strigata]